MDQVRLASGCHAENQPHTRPPRRGAFVRSLSAAALLGIAACSGDAAKPSTHPGIPMLPTLAGSSGSVNGASTGTNPGTGPSGASNPAAAGSGGAANAGRTLPPGQTPNTQTQPPMNPAGTAGMAAVVPPVMQTPFTGPLDGDPSKPMVEVPGLKCGPLAGGFGAAPQTVKITNRDVVVGYPCAHEGAAVTFFLFLHGTLQEEQKVAFTMNTFAIHKLLDSHNVIMVLPKAIGTQWGNGDNGQDLPHLYEVIDWVYATFGTKFNIRSMWSQGGSWGAAYLSRFACDAKLKDRLRGIQLIVGGGCPTCSDRLSCIVGQQELQLGNNMMLTPDQREMYADQANIGPYATKHGCKAKQGPTDVGNVKYWAWPDCQPGWAHSYYMAPGQHADAWDAAAVLKMTEEMKGTEK